MITIYRKLFELLDSAEKKRFYALLMLIIINAIVEMIGVASVLPFLVVLSDPALIHQHRPIQVVYDFLGFTDDERFQIFLGFAVLGLVIFGVFARFVTLYALSKFSQMRNFSISNRLLKGYLDQPYVFFLSRHSTSMTKSILSEVERVVAEGLVPALRILAQTVSLTCLIGLLCFVNLSAAIFAAGVLGGLYVVIFLFVRKFLTRVGRERASANRDRYMIAHEVLGGVKDVKLLGLEQSYLQRFRTPSKRLAAAGVKASLASDAPRFLLEAVAFGGMVLLVLSFLIRGEGDLKVILPTLGVFAFAGLRMFPALQQIYSSFAKMKFVGPMLDNVHHDVTHFRMISDVRKNRSSDSLVLKSFIELSDVKYRYPGSERTSLAGVSLAIPAHTTVGFVGGTGAGKTTLVDVILGLLRPDDGNLSVDGVAIADENLRSWQNALGYVPQHIYLIDDSIAANIAFGVPRGSRDQLAIENAARLAELHDFVVDELPSGYDTAVGERGVRLSGGQRQRIGIARALYHDPSVLIFDEATSALDNLTELAVMESVQKLGRSKTIIMIAHRLTTVRNCDRIFLMDKGLLVASGTYDDLLENNEIFRRMTLVDVPPSGSS